MESLDTQQLPSPTPSPIEIDAMRMPLPPAPLDGGSQRTVAELQGQDRAHLDGRRVLAGALDAAVGVAAFLLLGGDALALVAAVALTLAYFFVGESLTGQTLGKRLTNLRVVRWDGYPLAPGDVARRTMLRVVDGGILSALLTGGRRQRLGDRAAGTVVASAKFPAPRAEMRARLIP
jgi:uncharacterized RDD family membrane protein YckC